MRLLQLITFVLSALSTIGATIVRTVDAFFASFSFEPRLFAATSSVPLVSSGTSLPSSLLASLRHEAGVSRRSAERNI